MGMKTMLIAALLFAAPASWAAKTEAPKSKLLMLKTWFKHLKQGLTESSVSGEFQRQRVTAVAAVRGNAQAHADPDRVAWKTGSSKKVAEQRAEKAELSAAVGLLEEGKVGDGIAALESFEKAHPQSLFLKEASEAKEKAKELEAAMAAEPSAVP